ncbi:alpha/beta hydrolase family protein [Rhizobium leguminosarum]|uniref:alpha/beta hydrolase family protein n=1 Tax=Rhizobium leguminosarum TaxID=384 RepID=UPI003D6FB61C
MKTSVPAPSEKQISFVVTYERVAGTLRLASAALSPVVVLLHGFGGHRDELAIDGNGPGIFTYTAKRLGELGFSSLRIDFRGVGDSEGRFEETTYSSQVADCLAAMDFLSTVPTIDPNRMFLLGWSQGGLVSALAAARTNRPAGVALWAAVGEPSVSFPTLVGSDAYIRGLNSRGTTSVEMPWGASIVLGHNFFQEVSKTKPIEEIASYEGPLFIAEGTLDTAIPTGTAAKFAKAHRAHNETWIDEMDHAFNTSQGVGTLNKLIDKTASFFRQVSDKPEMSHPI